MKSTEKLTALGIPSAPDAELLSKIHALSPEQLLWVSGYCSGLSAKNSSLSVDYSASNNEPNNKISLNILILFASQTGNAEAIAQQLHQNLSSKRIQSAVTSTLDIKLNKLKDYSHIFVVASTHGEGEPPDDALDFYDGIFGKKAPKLEHLQHAVLALGDSSYEFYCQTGKDFDLVLSKLGSTPFVPRKDCDVDYETDAEQWVNDVSMAVEALHKEQSSSQGASVVQLYEVPTQKKHSYTKDNPYTAEVLGIQKITAKDSVKNTYHIEIDLDGSGIEYQPGDSLGIIANNDDQLVSHFLRYFDLDADTQLSFKDGQVGVGKLLSETLELTILNKPSLLQFAELTDSDNLKETVESNFSTYAETHQWIDVLMSSKIKPEPQAFIDLLKPIKPRLYSIASSLDENPEEVHLTVNLVSIKNENAERYGLASHYLIERLNEGDEVQVYIDTNKNFKLPAADKPVIMVGPGTGVAPFRAFLQQREFEEAAGKNWLFFGNPNFQRDFLYQTEFQKFIKKGLLNRIGLAFSRDQKEKVYVQHRILEEAELVWQWIDKENASFYVCGDMSCMAKDVEIALLKVFEQQGNLNAEQAKQYLKKLRSEKRYQRDVY